MKLFMTESDLSFMTCRHNSSDTKWTLKYAYLAKNIMIFIHMSLTCELRQNVGSRYTLKLNNSPRLGVILVLYDSRFPPNIVYFLCKMKT